MTLSLKRVRKTNLKVMKMIKMQSLKKVNLVRRANSQLKMKIPRYLEGLSR